MPIWNARTIRRDWFYSTAGIPSSGLYRAVSHDELEADLAIVQQLLENPPSLAVYDPYGDLRHGCGCCARSALRGGCRLLG